MNEYIQAEETAEVAVKRKSNNDLVACGKMLIAFMVLNIALRVVTGLFLPDGVVAALCPTVSFALTFPLLFNRDYNRLLKGQFAAPKKAQGKVMSGIADCMFAVFAVTVCLGAVTAVIDLSGIDIFSPAIGVSVSIKGFGGVVYLIYMCFIAPVMHELIFRGVVMKSLEERGEGTAVFVSALLYGLLHGVYITAVYAFVLGLLLGRMSLKVKSLTTMIKISMISSLIIYATMFTVSRNLVFLYIPMLIIFGFFALVGLFKAVLGFLAKKKKRKTKTDFAVVCTVPVAGAAILMILEDILFIVLKGL